MSARFITEEGPALAPVFAAIHAEAFPHEPWDAAAMSALLGTPGTFGLLARSAEPDGLALFRMAADEAEILTFGVVPAARRRGAGRDLLQALIRAAIRHGANVVFLEVAVDNTAARALYRGAGFVEVGRRPAYYGSPSGPRGDALILKLTLAQWLGPREPLTS